MKAFSSAELGCCFWRQTPSRQLVLARISLDTMDKRGFVVPQGAGPPVLPAVLSPAAWPAPAASRQQQSMTLFPHEDIVFAKM